MLYLLRSYIKDGSILKIGYASDIEKRIYNYTSHNPGIEVLGTKEGDLRDEAKLHLYFQKYRDRMNEWYEDREEVVDGFLNTNSDEINTYLWENRDSIFNFENNRTKTGTTTKSIYEELSKLFGIKFEDISTLSKTDLDYYNIFINQPGNIVISQDIPEELIDFVDSFNRYSQFTDRMKLLCDLDPAVINKNLEFLKRSIPRIDYFNYYETLGPDKCKALKCFNHLLRAECDNRVVKKGIGLSEDIESTFIIGERYSFSEIKKKLKELYDKYSCKSTPKASSIEDWFDVKVCNVCVTVDGVMKRDKGYQILGKKKRS